MLSWSWFQVIHSVFDMNSSILSMSLYQVISLKYIGMGVELCSTHNSQMTEINRNQLEILRNMMLVYSFNV